MSIDSIMGLLGKESSTVDQDSLEMHASGRPGKIEITPTKPLDTQRDLALAYSPGVGAPCLAIEKDPEAAFDYTARGNLVAIISNGTAVLGLGNLGALASKPVMEGKAVLFKKFADVDGMDIELATENVDEIVNAVKLMEPTFGGINLEDIKAPECFMIEDRLKKLMDIPVFHDDQHGTAIVAAAGLINALYITDRKIKNCRIVVNGAGASATACIELIKSMGLPHENAILCDSKGVIYKGRTQGMNPWKEKHAVHTDKRTLAEAVKGADIFLGLSVKDALTPDMLASMADKPIVFAMANPDPEIRPEIAKSVRPDAIIATGRSDYPNQVNNVLGFPYIFRGALDVRAKEINEPMKIAAAKALAELARLPVPEEVNMAYPNIKLAFGNDYIIPVPFDTRLIHTIPVAVAKAAIETGVARKQIDLAAYEENLKAKTSSKSSVIQTIFEQLRGQKKRVVFAEGEEERMLRAAIAFKHADYGVPILIGRESEIKEVATKIGVMEELADIQIHDIRANEQDEQYVDFLYKRAQRKGLLLKDCQRLVDLNRNVYAACMVGTGAADAMVTGLTRTYAQDLEEITTALEEEDGKKMFGMSVVMHKDRTLFIADTNVHETPTSEELALIAEQAAEKIQKFGITPRVALLSHSNFGNPMRESAERIRKAVKILDDKGVSFEYDGEVSAEVALDKQLMKLYPFCRLTDTANVLIMPELHAANITTHLLKKLGEGTIIGPILAGLERSVQIVQMGSSVTDLVNSAAFAAHDAISNDFFAKFLED
ncbi:MAG: NADP-dependent malic enzyme [Alphaproteobacteria bacterium]